MALSTHTRTIARLLRQAEHHARCAEWDAAARYYYQILTLDPTNLAVPQALQQLYQQPDLINDIQQAFDRLFCPPNASSGHLRRKLAFSYRVLSCWAGWLRPEEERTPVPVLEEAAEMLDHAYLSGEEHDLPTIWRYYLKACVLCPAQRRPIQWWMARQYAQHGFFADAAEILTEVLAENPADLQAPYMLAEMRWWRDYAHNLLWLRAANRQ